MNIENNSDNYAKGIPSILIELYGAEFIQITSSIPDPSTYRKPYYYNSRVNKLFKRIEQKRSGGVVSAYWQDATQSFRNT